MCYKLERIVYTSLSRVNGKGQDDIDLMLAWEHYLRSQVPLFIFLTFDKGLKLLLTFMATMLVAGCTLRIIPRTFLLSSTAGEKYDLYIVHAAQIMFALTGPIAMATPPRLSATWFAPSERLMSTALASSSAFWAWLQALQRRRRLFVVQARCPPYFGYTWRSAAYRFCLLLPCSLISHRFPRARPHRRNLGEVGLTRASTHAGQTFATALAT